MIESDVVGELPTPICTIERTCKKNMKELKPVKKVPFLVVTPLLSIIFEVLFIFALLAVMDSLVFNKRNMASLLMALVIGAVLWAVYGLAEYLMRRTREMQWYLFGVGAYIIPAVFWGVTALISYTYWYGHRLSENAEFFMYLTRTMLLYLFWAALFRFAGHGIFVLAGGGVKKKKSKKKSEKANKKEKSKENQEREITT
jgi:hypothetical protein